MRVHATAMGSAESDAIGQVELSCTPAGLAIGLFGVGAFSQGYATGAFASGTYVTVAYHSIVDAKEEPSGLRLTVDCPELPYKNLFLSRFVAGPGVPREVLQKRRAVLHWSALSVGVLASLTTLLLFPAGSSQLLTAILPIGLLGAGAVLFLGFLLNQDLMVAPPTASAVRQAFIAELSSYLPTLKVQPVSTEGPPRERLHPARGLPRGLVGIAVLLATTALTAVITGQKLFGADARTARPASQAVPTAAAPSPKPEAGSPRSTLPPTPSGKPGKPQPRNQEATLPTATLVSHCVCDRARSQLWEEPIPKLSTLLLEERAISLKNYVKTALQVAVINNGDEPIRKLTLHVQFFEKRAGKLVPTKERPLYFEGPLRPGRAVKWSTEARGTDFHIATPDLGRLAPNGAGSAPPDAFFELLSANHRPVRLHAARLLSFLGDPRAREGALVLKDAMRVAEGPFLRRVLMATSETILCDVQLEGSNPPTLSACVYNATEHEVSDLGVQANLLSSSLDVAHPLADPPKLVAQSKWSLAENLPGQTGRVAQVELPPAFSDAPERHIELYADKYSLLE